MNGEVGGKWFATTGAQYWCENRAEEFPGDRQIPTVLMQLAFKGELF